MAADHVILYVQGTHRFRRGLTIDRFTDGLSKALGPDFRPSGATDTCTFEGTTISGRMIERRGTNGHEPCIRVLEADYYDIFEEWDEKWLPARAVQTVWLVLRDLPLAARIFTFPNWAELGLQFLYILALVLVTIMAPALILFALWELGTDLGDAIAKLGAGAAEQAQSGGAGTSAAEGSSASRIAGLLAGAVSVFVLAKLVWSALLPKEMRDAIAMFARDPLCMLQYFTAAPKSDPVANRIASRIDKAYRFARQHHPNAEIHVVGYSFGAVMAFDWLFPRGSAATGNPPKIGALVTLGFPFRMVATFWPDYFQTGRSFTRMPMQVFHNCTLEKDLVGSEVPVGSALHVAAKTLPAGNFEDHTDPLPSGLIKVTGLPPWDGIKAHAAYFGFESRIDTPAFERCAAALSKFL